MIGEIWQAAAKARTKAAKKKNAANPVIQLNLACIMTV